MSDQEYPYLDPNYHKLYIRKDDPPIVLRLHEKVNISGSKLQNAEMKRSVDAIEAYFKHIYKFHSFCAHGRKLHVCVIKGVAYALFVLNNYAYAISVSGTPKCVLFHTNNNSGNKRLGWTILDMEDMSVMQSKPFVRCLRSCLSACGIDKDVPIEEIDILPTGNRRCINKHSYARTSMMLKLMKEERISDIYVKDKNQVFISFSTTNVHIVLLFTPCAIDPLKYVGKKLKDCDMTWIAYEFGVIILSNRSCLINVSFRRGGSYKFYDNKCITNMSERVLQSYMPILKLRKILHLNRIRSFQRLWRRWWYEPNEEGYVRFASRMYDKDAHMCA